jgi:hypothetical protein
MAAHKEPASLRPRYTRSGNSIAAIPGYQSFTSVMFENSQDSKIFQPNDTELPVKYTHTRVHVNVCMCIGVIL